jgi:dihydrodipicolinate synthase/N-acetylneuraminate lyase
MLLCFANTGPHLQHAGNTGVNLSSGLVARLSKHPNIAGVKDSGGNIVQISR